MAQPLEKARRADVCSTLDQINTQFVTITLTINLEIDVSGVEDAMETLMEDAGC